MELWETLSHTLHFKMVWEIVLNQVVTSTWLKAPLWTKESSSKTWQVTLMFMKKAHEKTFLTREKLDIQIKIWTICSIFFIFQCIRKGRLNLTDKNSSNISRNLSYLMHISEEDSHNYIQKLRSPWRMPEHRSLSILPLSLYVLNQYIRLCCTNY